MHQCVLSCVKPSPIVCEWWQQVVGSNWATSLRQVASFGFLLAADRGRITLSCFHDLFTPDWNTKYAFHVCAHLSVTTGHITTINKPLKALYIVTRITQTVAQRKAKFWDVKRLKLPVVNVQRCWLALKGIKCALMDIVKFAPECPLAQTHPCTQNMLDD